MLVEIEECVRFLTSFLLGNVPRRRVKSFAGHLANALAERIYNAAQSIFVYPIAVNVADDSGDAIVEASSAARLHLEEIRRLWPKGMVLELRPGSIMAVNAETGQMKVVFSAGDRNLHGGGDGSAFDARDRRRSPFVALANSEQHKDASKQQMGDLPIRIEWASGMDDAWHRVKATRPFFHVARDDGIYPAHVFAATRFGSTKFKTNQNQESSVISRAYTTPSVCAHLQLLVFLNALACLTVWSEQSDDSDNSNNASSDERDHSA
ncbi:Protein T09B4.6 [Aphelenchoides avenae]|nr:Protein T09B4.6 [Aphelenchus avenae]